MVSHTYFHCGSFDVSLTITNECGTHSITIYDLIKIRSSYVTKEVGEGYPYQSIQEAIDKAVYGDIILVHDGTYIENINFKGKVITVCSENGPVATVINGDAKDIVVTFDHGELSSSVLEGFTIRNGLASSGGGISCVFSSSPRIIKCIIRDSIASDSGGGIYIHSSSPQIINCDISGNIASEAGGILCQSSLSEFINCTIIGNTASEHSGGFCCYSSSSPQIINCTISDNTASNHGGGISCYYSSLKILNSILWGNMAGGISDEIFTKESQSMTVTYSDILQDAGVYPGVGNINMDPLFMGIEHGHYYLQKGSPCIDKGAYEDAPTEDKEGVLRPQGTGVDMGACEYVDSTSCTPKASFTVAQTAGIDPLTAYFDASFSGGSQYGGAGFVWEFGDGGTGNGMIVSHTYSRYGSYDVSLTVTTECGAHNLTWYDLVKIKSSQVTKEVGEGYDYASIQEAIDDAGYGDVILVHDGTYIENINFKGKVITVLSENGPAHTVITKKGGENTVEFNHAEGAYSVLEGFTIEEYPYQSGNGISCAFSSPQIINCNIKKIKRMGIDCHFSSPQIINCTITGNNRSGIYSNFSSPQIINCTISENGRSGIFSLNSTLAIVNCVIIDNTTPDLGGGIYCEDSKPTIINSMIQDNQAEGSANAVYLLESVPIVSNYSDMQLVNYGKDDRILIQKWNKNTGRWESGYRFFRKSCDTALPLETGEILFISSIP
jgi:parallel beta-helix repeat protein